MKIGINHSSILTGEDPGATITIHRATPTAGGTTRDMVQGITQYMVQGITQDMVQGIAQDTTRDITQNITLDITQDTALHSILTVMLMVTTALK